MLYLAHKILLNLCMLGNFASFLSYADFTLQEMCCGFLLSREMWYLKSVLPGTGAG